MKKTYNDFIESICISEEDFNKIMDLLPDVDVDFSVISWNDPVDFKCVFRDIVDEILMGWSFVYIDDFDPDEKTFSLEDVDSLEDLEEIKNTFSKWTISNYDQLKEELSESTEDKRKANVLNILKNLSTEKLEEIVDNL